MPVVSLAVAVVVRRGGDGLWRGEALLVPGSLRCGERAETVRAAVASVAATLLSRWLKGSGDPSDVQRFLVAEAPEVRWIDVSVPPGGRDAAWDQALSLSTPVVTWRHGGFRRGVLVAIGVEVVAEEKRFAAACAEQALAALERERTRGDLRRVLALAGDDEVSVSQIEVDVAIETADDADDAAAGDQAELTAVTRPLAGRSAVGLDAVVDAMAALLAGRRPRCVLLVGPSGAGKTAAVRALAARAHHLGLAQRPLLATGGARLVAGMGGFGMWQARCLALRRALHARRGILHVGSLRELMEVGRHQGNATGIADFMRPWLAAGELLAIAECTPEELGRLEAQSPAVIAAFAQVLVPEADAATTRAVLADWRRGAKAAVDDAALDAVVELHRRFAAYSAAPGRPLRFLIDLVHERAALVDRPAVVAAFTRSTGIPALLLDDRVTLDTVAARTWFRARVAGQDDAVDRVIDVLAVAKADLARRDRPLASLLFIGPTGVGKTELAKALAEFLYGDRGRLARFDMSEFGDASAAMRLAGWAGGPMGLLVARARREPFAVYLLDEIEKAHPLAFDLLLQALGEGRISDGSGRTGDLRSAVIVMTSNLGGADAARAISGFAGAGDDGGRFIAAVEQHFRPEFVNRLDAVVPFNSLPPAVARQVVARELAGLAQREGFSGRGVALECDPVLIDRLAVFDPATGARGLKRRLATAVALPAAELITRCAPGRGTRLAVSAEGARILSDGARRGVDDVAASTCAEIRRLAQRIIACSTVRALRAERARAVSTLNRASRRHRGAGMDPLTHRRLTHRRDAIAVFLTRAGALLDQALDGEEALLRASLAGGVIAGPVSGLDAEAQAVLAQVWTLEHDDVDADRVTIGLIGEPPEAALPLAEAVVAVAQAWGQTVRVARARRAGERWLGEADRALGSGLGEAPGAGEAILLTLRGDLAMPRWLGEAGTHLIVRASRHARVLVTVGPRNTATWSPPDELHRRGWLGSQRPRRRWDADARRVEENGDGTRWDGDLAVALRPLAAASFQRLLLAAIVDADAP